MILVKIDDVWYKTRTRFYINLNWEIIHEAEAIYNTSNRQWHKCIDPSTKHITEMQLWLNGHQHLEYLKTGMITNKYTYSDS